MKNRKVIILLTLLLLSTVFVVGPAFAAGGGAEAEAVAHGHEVDPVGDALISGLLSGGQAFIYITLAATLPLLWILTLIVHFNRPYIIRYLKKFTLRFGADIWWLLYVLLRDGIMVITFVLGLFLFFPDLFMYLPFPITAPLASVLLFWALTVKLTKDADDNASDYKKVSYLLIAGALVYLIPFIFGIEAPMSGWEQWRTLASSSQNQGVAQVILFISLGLFVLTGGYIFSFVVKKVKSSTVVKSSKSSVSS